MCTCMCKNASNTNLQLPHEYNTRRRDDLNPQYQRLGIVCISQKFIPCPILNTWEAIILVKKYINQYILLLICKKT